MGTPKVELPPAVVALLTAAVVVTTAAALLAGRRGLAVTPPAAPRRWDLALAWLPTVLVAAFVLRRALGLHETTGKVAFVQGRYLFGALVAAMAVVALGASRLLGRAAPAAALAVVAALQARHAGPRPRRLVDGAGAVRPRPGDAGVGPWPPAAVLAVAAAAVAVTGGLARHAARELRPRRP